MRLQRARPKRNSRQPTVNPAVTNRVAAANPSRGGHDRIAKNARYLETNPMPALIKVVLAAVIALSAAACATQQPVADYTPPPQKQVKDAKYDLESGKRRY